MTATEAAAAPAVRVPRLSTMTVSAVRASVATTLAPGLAELVAALGPEAGRRLGVRDLVSCPAADAAVSVARYAKRGGDEGTVRQRLEVMERAGLRLERLRGPPIPEWAVAVRAAGCRLDLAAGLPTTSVRLAALLSRSVKAVARDCEQGFIPGAVFVPDRPRRRLQRKPRVRRGTWRIPIAAAVDACRARGVAGPWLRQRPPSPPAGAAP